PDGTFTVATRRGKQFNSMVHERRDPLNGAVREAVLINPLDADRLGLADGEPVVLTSANGTLRGRILRAPVTPGNLQVHWPEGQVLIDRARRPPQAGMPDYNAVVRLERAAAPAGAVPDAPGAARRAAAREAGVGRTARPDHPRAAAVRRRGTEGDPAGRGGHRGADGDPARGGPGPPPAGGHHAYARRRLRAGRRVPVQRGRGRTRRHRPHRVLHGCGPRRRAAL